MNSRDAYLAWQAEIGTEEVVLVQPWIKPRPTATPLSASRPEAYAEREFEVPYRESPSPVRERAPGFNAVPASAGMTADFFQSIAESLAKPEPVSRRGTSAGASGAAPAAPKSSVSPAPFLPDHPNLEAYWAFLEASCPIWFPGAGNVARAEGSARPALALVELYPQEGRVFAGEPGAFLDKMMKGIGLTRDQLYLTSVMKSPPAGKTWPRKDVARMLPALLQELRLAEAGLVLVCGESCAQSVLRTGKSLAALMETAENQGNMTLVAVEHPSLLMHADEAARRAAWNQLKWLRGRLPAANS
jgi:uracil-DNA glycosylase family 4